MPLAPALLPLLLPLPLPLLPLPLRPSEFSQSCIKICATLGRADGSSCSMAHTSSRAPSGTLGGKGGSTPPSTASRVSRTSRFLSPPETCSASPARL
jgi:hypothetical protein